MYETKNGEIMTSSSKGFFQGSNGYPKKILDMFEKEWRLMISMDFEILFSKALVVSC